MKKLHDMSSEDFKEMGAVHESRFPVNPDGIGAYKKYGEWYVPIMYAWELGIDSPTIHECDY